ncbi:MAG: hypothetical protein JOY82_28365 [Streptosporangiaceae bacterium]|nr:hypothetical protein [Streptosporangiaceae bacterium]MBV9858400.1 hypothetical protein [Streptosporangiaceae bacterium]
MLRFKIMSAGIGCAPNTRQILPSYTSTSAKLAAEVHLSAYPTTPDAAALQRLANLMLSAGMLSSPLDASALVFR